MNKPTITNAFKKPPRQMWVMGDRPPDWLLAMAVLAARVERDEPGEAFVGLCDAYLRSRYPDAAARIAEAPVAKYQAHPELLEDVTPPEAATLLASVPRGAYEQEYESAATQFQSRWLGLSLAAGNALGKAVHWIAMKAESTRVAQAIEGSPVLMALLLGNTDAKPGKVAQRHLVTYIRQGFKALGAERHLVGAIMVDAEQYVAIECDHQGDVEAAARHWSFASSNLYALRHRFDLALGKVRLRARPDEEAEEAEVAPSSLSTRMSRNL